MSDEYKDFDWYRIRIRPHSVNKQSNFISGYYTKNTDVLKEINDVYDMHTMAGMVEEGTVGLGVDTNMKQSQDLNLNRVDNGLMERYNDAILKPAMETYLKQYPWAAYVGNFTPYIEGMNVQEYPAGGNGYAQWHFERNYKSMDRHLVFMTYLNDIDDGGETQFWFQDVSIKPEFGLTLIFPSDWTHTHRGESSPTQNKRIITGWFNLTGFEDDER
jgi:hypothetical protein